MLLPALVTTLLAAPGFSVSAQGGFHSPSLLQVASGPALAVSAAYRTGTRFGGELTVDRALLFSPLGTFFRSTASLMATFSVDATEDAELFLAAGGGADLLGARDLAPRLVAQLGAAYALTPRWALRADVRYGVGMDGTFPTDATFVIGARLKL